GPSQEETRIAPGSVGSLRIACDVGHEQDSTVMGGARGLAGSWGEIGRVCGRAGRARSVTTGEESSHEKATGNCPWATTWYIRQLAFVSRRDWPASSGLSGFEIAPGSCDDPGRACRHGPHRITAAWHAISEANRIWRTRRDIRDSMAWISENWYQLRE